MEQLIK